MARKQDPKYKIGDKVIFKGKLYSITDIEKNRTKTKTLYFYLVKGERKDLALKWAKEEELTTIV